MNTSENTENPVAKRLVDHYGGRPAAARAMKRSVETIRLWLLNGIPVGYAIEVEEKSAGVITAEEILEDAKRVQRLARVEA